MPISEEEANLNVAHFVTLAGTWRFSLLENPLPGPLLEMLASQWLDPHALDQDTCHWTLSTSGHLNCQICLC